MEKMSHCKLKISVENVNSDDNTSDSETDDFKSRRHTKQSSDKTSDGGLSEDQDSDKDDRISVSADADKPKSQEQRIKTYKNKAGTFVVGFDPTSQECRDRQEQRAKRFGDSVSSVALVTDEAIQKLYESLGVKPPSDDEENDVRYDTIHIRGVDDMSTTRVFDYFGEFAPAAIEWIDDTSCNVVWMDRIEAARALLKLSSEPTSENDVTMSSVETAENSTAATEIAADPEKPVVNNVIDDDEDSLNLLSDDDVAKLSCSTITAEENRVEVARRRSSVVENDVTSSRKEEDMDVDEAVAADTEEGKESERRLERQTSGEKTEKRRTKIQKIHFNSEKSNEMPPGRWRVGVPQAQARAKRLLMRFATKADIKQPGAAKRSKYYQKYGNPSFGGMKGIISDSRKRKFVSRKRQQDVEEARKAIEEAKWKRGVPEETKFDRHVEEAETKRARLRQNPVVPDHSDESDDSSNALVVEDRVERSPKKKRFMKMYADDVEGRSLSDRLGARVFQGSRPSVRDRLGATSQSRVTSGDLRNRLGRR